jgi:chemotaxis protein histidine kinase CheA
MFVKNLIAPVMTLLDREKLTEPQQQDLLFDLLLENNALLKVLLVQQARGWNKEEVSQQARDLFADVELLKQQYLQDAKLPKLEPAPQKTPDAAE